MFAPLDNKIVGNNIAKLRRHRDVKAADVATKLGLTESAYTKYERGDTAITIDFLNKIAEQFEVSPNDLINSTPSNIIENIHESSGAVANLAIDSTFNVTNNAQEKLLETVIEQNKKLAALLEKLADKL